MEVALSAKHCATELATDTNSPRTGVKVKSSSFPMLITYDKAHTANEPNTRFEEKPSRQYRLAVIVPAFDEAETIGQTIEGLRGIEARLNRQDVKLSIIIINDGSSDNTGDLAKQFGADTVLTHPINLGLGAAVRTGIQVSQDREFDIVVKIDADLQHDPEDVLKIIRPILADEADIVFGNRVLEYRMPFVRRVGNFLFSRVMRWLTGWPLADSQPGIFCINQRYAAVSFIPGDYNYAQQILIDAHHNHMRFAHVPVAFRRRTTGNSFVSLKYPFEVVPQIVIAIAAVKPLRIFLPMGLLLLATGGVIFLVQLMSWLFGNSTKPVENVNLVLGLLLFGVQTLFFGILAELIVQTRRR